VNVRWLDMSASPDPRLQPVRVGPLRRTVCQPAGTTAAGAIAVIAGASHAAHRLLGRTRFAGVASRRLRAGVLGAERALQQHRIHGAASQLVAPAVQDVGVAHARGEARSRRHPAARQ